MIPRLITVFIFVFCGTMTTLLVRSVLYPRGTGLAKVSPQAAFDFFAARSEGSNLDVWEGNHITGSAQITPHGSIMRPKEGTASVKVNISVLIRLPQPILNSETIKLAGDAILHSDGRLDDLDLELYLPGSLPRVSLIINQPAGKPFPSLTLKQANTVLFSNEPGKEQSGPMALMVETMLKGTGLSMDALHESKAESPAEVRTGYFDAGGSKHDGFLLTNGEDSSSRFDLYMANTGEVLRIDTPLTGDNELGLRFLAENLRPPDTPDPNLDEYRDLKKRFFKK
jgi:hypothetical protein